MQRPFVHQLSGRGKFPSPLSSQLRSPVSSALRSGPSRSEASACRASAAHHGINTETNSTFQGWLLHEGLWPPCMHTCLHCHTRGSLISWPCPNGLSRCVLATSRLVPPTVSDTVCRPRPAAEQQRGSAQPHI